MQLIDNSKPRKDFEFEQSTEVKWDVIMSFK